MDKLNKRTIEIFQRYRSEKLGGLCRWLAKLGITANHLTFLSLVSGLLSIYFLFDNYFYFVLFAILHLFLDALDGVLARISGETFFGKCFDMATDNFITFLALIKVGFFINDIYPQIIAFLYLVIVGVHLQSKFKIPVIFIRSAALGVLIVSSYPTFPYMDVMLTVGYLAAGATIVFSLARQLQWFFGRKI